MQSEPSTSACKPYIDAVMCQWLDSIAGTQVVLAGGAMARLLRPPQEQWAPADLDLFCYLSAGKEHPDAGKAISDCIWDIVQHIKRSCPSACSPGDRCPACMPRTRRLQQWRLVLQALWASHTQNERCPSASRYQMQVVGS